jgi:hydroxymethylpyrimidine/phosphomethylpyrimidine kinase
LRNRLLPLVDWVTPNLAELAELIGRPIGSRDDLPRSARELQMRVARSGDRQPIGVFATGGHLDPPDDLLVTPSGEAIWLPGRRVETPATHGTGCALSSAFLSRLVLGNTPAEAARAAKHYVARALATATPRGQGHGPMNHLWPLAHPPL